MKRWPVLAALVAAAPVFGQTTLGALLDAGAKPLSAAQFQEQVVQRTIVGPLPTGGQMEMMYVSNGTIQGVAAGNSAYITPISGGATAPISGEWRIDDAARVCTTMRIVYGSGTAVVMPARCQHWFKFGNDYFFADSDTDRSVRVLKRTIRQ